MSQPIFAILSALCVGKASREVEHAQNVRWGEFVTRYRPMMEVFMRERFPSLEADDIIQETLVVLCRVLPSYRYAPDEKGHFHNYLTGILRNKALRALRKREQDEALRADYAAEGVNRRGNGTLAASGRARSLVAPQAPPPGRAVAPRPPPELDFIDEQSYRESLFELALRQSRVTAATAHPEGSPHLLSSR